MQEILEKRRGCGFRKPGLYLVAPPNGHPCCKLPIPLARCPSCGGGIKPARGFTWFDSNRFVSREPCQNPPGPLFFCPLAAGGLGRQGLIWVGEKFYSTPADFLGEARDMGFSRRIPHLPKEFVIGETWIFLAHRLAVPDPDGPRPGLFAVFRPTEVQLVTRGNESPEELARWEKRGVTPVKVVPIH